MVHERSTTWPADGCAILAMDYFHERIVVQGEWRLSSLALVTGSSTLSRLMIAVTHSGRQHRSRPQYEWDTALPSGSPQGYSMPKC